MREGTRPTSAVSDGMDFRLTEEQIVFYHQHGYLAIEAITTLVEVSWMADVYDRLFAQQAGRERGDQFDLAGTDEEGVQASLPQILGPSKYAPELRDTHLWRNARSMVKQLLGETADVGGDHAIFKPPRHGAATPWHQDEAYWDPMVEYESLSIWVPLQAATIENGCMWFVPGSHRLEVLPHHSIGHDPRVHGLEVEGADVTQSVACPLPAGGATFHHCRTLHYAGPNASDLPRRAYILGGGLPGKPRTAERRFPWNEIKQTARQARARSQA